jgi:bifunctional non-homologous end joining protein LigD
VIGGYRPASTTFDALVIGYYEGRTLHYAAKLRAGFTPHQRREIFALVANTEVARCPFADLPNSAGRSRWGAGITSEDMRELRWVRPRQAVEVAFVEWTHDGVLRHPRFVGLRNDKAPRSVRREA